MCKFLQHLFGYVSYTIYVTTNNKIEKLTICHHGSGLPYLLLGQMAKGTWSGTTVGPVFMTTKHGLKQQMDMLRRIDADDY